ncbi:MAG: DUF1294 domain-containing protein [Clostridiales bacterium]|nr:DUF1294 domain-containing protein [Clostridiales bacterium]
MVNLLYVLYAWLIAANAAAFVMYGIDKAKAKRGAWRISEAALLLIAAVGGSIGAIAGMVIFRHKTKHLKFLIGLPLILIIQLAVWYLIASR